MKKIHISLVGGQPIPVFLGIGCDDFDEIVLIHSGDSVDETVAIEKICKKKCTLIQCSPNDIVEIRQTAENLFASARDNHVVLNITSGTKLWSVIFSQTFLNHASADIVFIDQLNNLYNLKSGETKQLSIDIFTRFQLYGTPLLHYTRIEEYTQEDGWAIQNIEKARYTNIYDFNELTNQDLDIYNDTEGEIRAKNGSKMKWNWDEGYVEFQMTNRYGRYVNSIEVVCAHVREVVLHNAWFELKTALELKKRTNVKGIYLNCEFLTKEKDPKNEIDIIADFGYRLLFVECKTMVHDVTDIDKFRSAMRNFSGTSSIGVFVTNDMAKTGNRYNRYKNAMEKCRDNYILTFNFSMWDKKENTSLNSIVNRNIRQINKR